jgi:hypothetical protein
MSNNETVTNDLTTIKGVVALMESSKTRAEWNANCDAVKTANGRDYPDFWYQEIVESGIATAKIAEFQYGEK